MIFDKSQVAFVTALTLLTSPAFGQPSAQDVTSEQTATKTAQRYMDEGAALYAKADWAGAHVAFLKAWEVVQHRAIATNLADVEIRLGLYVQASERLKHLISTLPGDHKDEVAALQSQLAECRRHTTSLRITSNVKDAIVQVNGKDLGTVSSLGELLVEPGPAVIVLTRPGYQDRRSEVLLATGESKTLEFDLQLVALPPAAKPEVPTTTSNPPPAPERHRFGAREYVAVGGAALTIAAGVVGVVYWRKGENAYDEADRIKNIHQLGEGGCYPGSEVDVAACHSLRDSVRRADDGINIMRGAFITAGVLGAATVATYLFWPTKTSSQKAAFTPWSSAGGGGVALVGSF